MTGACRDVEALSGMQHYVTVAQVKRHFALHAVQDLVVIVGMCFMKVVCARAGAHSGTLATSHEGLFAVVLCLFLSGFDCSARHGPGIC
jgi:hypothetical protein